jgi:hypothetical protein
MQEFYARIEHVEEGIISKNTAGIWKYGIWQGI